MMKHEFEALVEKEIGEEEWEIVETVYLYYDENLDKKTIAALYNINPTIIYDMYPRAQKIREVMNVIEEKQKELATLRTCKFF